MEFVGKVKAIGETVEFTGQNGQVQKKTIVVERQIGDFSDSMAFDTFRPESLEGISVGDRVRIVYKARSREYNGNWYNSLTIISITKLEKRENSSDSNSGSEAEKDLPF